MLKLFGTAVLGVSATLAQAGDVQACGGCGGGQRCAPAAAPSCAAPAAPAAMPDGHEGMAMPPSAAGTNNGRSTYRSYSYDPGYQAPGYQAPVMRRSAPSTYNRFDAGRKIRGAY